MDLELIGLNRDSGLAADFFTEADVTAHASLIFELHIFEFLLALRNELEVDHGLELDVRSRHQRMQVQLVWLRVTLRQDLNHVMEVSRLSRFKLHAHLDREPSCNAPNILILAVEARVARLGEHDATHILRNVPDGHCHLVVLVRLNVCIQKRRVSG